MKNYVSILLMLFPVNVFGAIIYVPGDYPNIQQGINAASDGDTVMVANGTYSGGYPDFANDLDFDGKAITVRSASDNPELCIIDADGSAGYPRRCFDFHNGEVETSVLSGFTLQGGYSVKGGGIRCMGASPLIRNCIITNNKSFASDLSDGGGGIYCGYGSSSSPTIIDCIVSSNESNSGGGICCDHAKPKIINSAIYGNISNGTASCGGISCFSSNASIIGCTISGNTGVSQGGGICAWDTSGSASTPEVVNCVITGNTSGSGGGIWYSSYSISDYIYPVVLNCLIYNNTATADDDEGGGVFCRWSVAPYFENCTIVNNTGCGFHFGDRCLTTFTNGIIWGNTPHQIAYSLDAPPDITYSVLSFDWVGTGNINADPLFANGPLGNFYLSQTASGQNYNSPGVNAGSDLASLVCFSAADEVICMDDFTTRTDEVLDQGVVDIGFHYGMNSSFPTPTPTPYFEEPSFELTLNNTLFLPGDLFLLQDQVHNPSPTISVEEYIVLDVYSQFFFWPSWVHYPEGIDSEIRQINGYSDPSQTILTFTWPSNCGSANGLRFWGVLLQPGTSNIYGELVMVEFSFSDQHPTFTPTPASFTATPSPGNTCLQDQYYEESSGIGANLDNLHHSWQNFFPLRNYICELEILISKGGNPGNLVVSIKDDLSGTNLWSETRFSSDIHGGMHWLVFDVSPDIFVIPGNSYYIDVCQTENDDYPDHYYLWIGDSSGLYPGNSDINDDYDYCFRLRTLN